MPRSCSWPEKKSGQSFQAAEHTLVPSVPLPARAPAAISAATPLTGPPCETETGGQNQGGQIQCVPGQLLAGWVLAWQPNAWGEAVSHDHGPGCGSVGPAGRDYGSAGPGHRADP